VTDNASHRFFPAPQRTDVNVCPQTGNHHNKANPSAAVTSPLVATDNASHRPRPKGTSQRTTWADQGDTAREQGWDRVGGTDTLYDLVWHNVPMHDITVHAREQPGHREDSQLAGRRVLR
ncbi:MAG: hypothetical protein GY832_17665, partial [Chloroflexi bacterium]|nr:hypothetical protein [Chloroflexota bacterium]